MNYEEQEIYYRFECGYCGNIHSIQQKSALLTKPVVCSCGEKKRFTLIYKGLIKSQREIYEKLKKEEFYLTNFYAEKCLNNKGKEKLLEHKISIEAYELLTQP